MTKTQLLILVTVLVIGYFYWKQQQKTRPHHPDDIIERKGKDKEVFWDAEDYYDLSSDNESTNSDHD